MLVAHGSFKSAGAAAIWRCNGMDTDNTVTVSVPDHRALRTGTLVSIVRQSGVPRSAFEEQIALSATHALHHPVP